MTGYIINTGTTKSPLRLMCVLKCVGSLGEETAPSSGRQI